MKKNVSLLALAIILSCQLLTAQNFITQWNLATPGSGATQLSIRTTTSGTVNYTWQQVPAGASGSGSWSGALLTITGLPAGATVRLQIAPANFQRIFINYDADKNRLTQIEQWGSIAWTSMANAFQGCTNLQVTATDVPDLSGVNSLQQMFEGCTNLNSPANINTWNIGAVTNLSYMFALTNAFNQNIGSWNTAAVTNMQGMFYEALAFNQNIGSWNTAAVTNMYLMFYRASAFNQNIGLWNTAAVTTMESMFSGAIAFNQNISSWNTAAVTNMSFMFSRADAFNQNIGLWNTAAVTNMSAMFANTSAFNQNIGSWNTTAVTDMNNMFREAIAFNNGGSNSINNWNTAAVTNMSFMFAGASAFNQNIGSWNTTAVTDMKNMFWLASTFDNGGNNSIINWNTAAVTDMRSMFQEASAFNQNIGSWNTDAVTDMSSMFSGASVFNQNIGSWALNPGVDMSNMLDNSGLDCNNYSATLIGWNANASTPNGRTLGANTLEYGTNAVAARTNLTGAKGWTITGDTPSGFSCVPINSNDFVTVWNLGLLSAPNTQITFGVATSDTVNYTWETIPAAATGSGTFSGSTATITGLPAFAIIRLSIQPANFQRINIDQGIDRAGLTLVENWGTTTWTSMQTAFRGCFNMQVTANDVPNLSGVTDLSEMFAGCTNLNSPSNINMWNTTAVTNMQNMFEFTSAFNQNIGAWNTANVDNMSGMFANATAFNQDISSWNTATVFLMANMFNGASAFNQNIGSWNTNLVDNMASMFSGASAFNQNLSTWILNLVVNLSNMLDNSGMDCNNYSATLIGWNANPATPNGRTLGATGRQYGTIAVAARTNLTGTKGWIITGDAPSGTACGVILPVTWLYVNGQLKNNTAIIKWATASEANTKNFEVEHSTNGINFNKVGARDAAGNSNSSTQNEFIHPSPLSGRNYYRIKQIDIDGRFSYSSVILIQRTDGKNILTIFPNPAKDVITISLNKSVAKTTLQIYNPQGQLVMQRVIAAGVLSQSLDISLLPQGMYLIQLLADGETTTAKFLKQ